MTQQTEFMNLLILLSPRSTSSRLWANCTQGIIIEHCRWLMHIKAARQAICAEYWSTCFSEIWSAYEKPINGVFTGADQVCDTVSNVDDSEQMSLSRSVCSGARAEEGNSAVESPGRFTDQRKKAREQAEKNDADFASSEFLKGLRDKSDLNKAR